jgi:hypothetical protein
VEQIRRADPSHREPSWMELEAAVAAARIATSWCGFELAALMKGLQC